MPRIRQLEPLIVNKIAAGEVIERPGSVVKELLENSIDALATRIEVEVAEGGAELIRVVDDGEGIHPDDLALAVASHATSKIETDDDLFRVQTMGFRGEALASIAAVSRVRLRTRQPDAASGFELEVQGGRPGTVQPCGCPTGTIIEVRQLFFNTPVRRKFLKTISTEFGHVSEQFTRIALANPRLHLVLKHNARTVYELPATERLIDRVRLFFGSDLADSLIPVESQAGDVRLWGYAAHPEQSKATRKGQYLFLNGRWIQDRSLQHALGEAYRGLLMTGRYPVTFLFLEMPSEGVDVNVHPTKAEVRFRDSQQLYRQMLSMLRTKFLGLDLGGTLRIPVSNVQPVSPDQQRELQRDLADWAKGQLAAWQPTERIGTPVPPASGGRQPPGPTTDPSFDSLPTITPRHDAPFPTPRHAPGSDTTPSAESNESATDNRNGQSAHQGEQQREHEAHGPRPVGLGDASARVMQIHDCYLVVETDAGLTVIDQHALHERVMYEHLRRRVLSGTVESQRLLVPDTVEMNPGEAELVLEQRELLEQLGFGIEEFGKHTLLLTAYPPMLARADLSQLVRDVADQLASAGRSPSRRDLLDHLLHTMACKAAIKAGQRLTPEEIESLLAYRHLIDDAHHCPHGRPTALVLTRAELDRQFGRLG